MLARRMQRVTPSPIMELIKTTAGGDYISFASGLPDPSLFPVETIGEITDAVLRRDGQAALQYGAAEGYGPLRELVAEMLKRRSLPVTAAHILITNGSQQALDLAARALLEEGDAVAIESPTYLAALQVFDSYGARYTPIPMDACGMTVDGARQALAQRPKLLYALPNFQNPTGITLAAERRGAIAEAVAEAGVALIEDDAYYDLRYEGDPLPPLCALASNPLGLYTGTFSKCVAPGLRVGYLAAEPALVARLAQLKQITDLHSGSLTQRVVYEYCVRGHLEPGIARYRAVYARRRDALLNALETHLTEIAAWTSPTGGMFVFVTLPEAFDTTRLLEQAMARGVLFVPGAGFHPDGCGRNTLRLNFVSVSEERIRAGVEILAAVIREQGKAGSMANPAPAAFSMTDGAME